MQTFQCQLTRKKQMRQQRRRSQKTQMPSLNPQHPKSQERGIEGVPKLPEQGQSQGQNQGKEAYQLGKDHHYPEGGEVHLHPKELGKDLPLLHQRKTDVHVLQEEEGQYHLGQQDEALGHQKGQEHPRGQEEGLHQILFLQGGIPLCHQDDDQGHHDAGGQGHQDVDLDHSIGRGHHVEDSQDLDQGLLLYSY